MPQSDSISLDDLLSKIHGRPALVVGPDLTGATKFEDTIAKELARKHELHPTTGERHLFDVVDSVLEIDPTFDVEGREKLCSLLKRKPGDPAPLRMLCRPNWCGVVSLTLDCSMFDLLKQHVESLPTRHSVTVIAKPTTSLPNKTIPYFSLLGHLPFITEDEKVVLSKSEYLVRKRKWPDILRQFPDVLRADPVFIFGCETIPERVCDFIDELLRHSPKVPSRLVFLKGDPLLENPTFRRLLPTETELLEVSTTLKELTGSLASGPSVYSLPLFNRLGTSRKHAQDLESISDVACVVPKKTEVNLKRHDHKRMLDYLFRPSFLDWAPYALEMAFRRDVEDKLVSEILTTLANPTATKRTVHVFGEAGSGKTSTLRAAAQKVAEKCDLVLWIRSNTSEIEWRRFRDALVGAVKITNTKGVNIAVFFDDPFGQGITPSDLEEIQRILSSCQTAWCLIFSTRQSDKIRFGDDNAEITVATSRWKDFEVQTSFSDAEMERLPAYLVEQKFAGSLEEASSLLPGPSGVKTRDILSSLWFAVPATRQQFTKSLEDEWLGLGDPTKQVVGIANKARKNLKVAQLAYETVAAASRLNNLIVPVEVLVSALGISYGAWIEQCYKDGKPIWGLIYDDELPDQQTIGYRTRNSLVSEILCGLMNRDRVERGGEMDALRKLVDACDSSSPVYREFVTSLLVGRRKCLAEFPPEQVLDLFDRALNAYPRGFGLLEHHRARVLAKIEGQSGEAYNILVRLIRDNGQRYTVVDDSRENLLVSAAATLTQRVADGEIEPKEGLAAISKHLTDALSSDQFRLHAYHTQANALLTLAGKIDRVDSAAAARARSLACRVLEKGLWLLESGGIRTPSDTGRMMADLRVNALYSSADIAEAKLDALRRFSENGEQALFVLVARRLLNTATSGPNPRSKDFKKADEYIHDVIKEVTNAQLEIDDELRWCRLEVAAAWQFAQGKGPVVWDRVHEDLLTLLGRRENRDDVRLNLWLALYLVNQGQMREAENRFAWLRRVDSKWSSSRTVHGYLVRDQSRPIELQGTVEVGAGRKKFIFVPELDTDVTCVGFDRETDDALVHFHLGVTASGPVAVPVVKM